VVVNAAVFKSSLANAAPAPSLAPPLIALWWAGKGDWDKAHAVVMKEDSKDAAWVHAYLHRLEGDLGNAGYWYRRAGRPTATNALEIEWDKIVAILLADEKA
jgi:hypothetical protein